LFRRTEPPHRDAGRAARTSQVNDTAPDTAAPRIVLTRAELASDEKSFARLKGRVFRGRARGVVRIGLAAVGRLTLADIAVLARLAGDAHERGMSLEFEGLPDHLRGALDASLRALLSPEEAARPSEPLLERVGEHALRVAADWTGWGNYGSDVAGAVFVDPLVGKPWIWRSIVEQMDLIGVRGAPLVVFISLLVGIVLAINGARELSQFGASIYIANLVGVTMTREMGPLMTAILIAGRSGSAIAAELGTMVVSEEIDAMRTMALEPNRFLIAPRMIALAIMVPCLTVMSDVFGIAGGFLVAVPAMGLGSGNYLRQTARMLYISDIVTGLFKSLVYAVLIGLISCHEGMNVVGGAQGVGAATTRSVVTAIIATIAADAVFTLFFYLIG
jgi:phospholipid/cholesterol/gamma-HCH transport system permease protein